MIDRLRNTRTLGKILSIALAIALLPWVAGAAEEDCTKLPDLWLPADGLAGLSDGGVSIQTTTGDVCQGDTVTITVTVDNLSCGDAGEFDVRVYYDDTSHIIGTQTVAGLPGCEYTVLTFTWDTDHVPSGEHDILVCVDTGHDVSELNENNNCLTIETDLLVRPNTPYVEVEKLAVDTDGGTVQAGDTIRYEVTIWNYGCDDLEDNPGHEFTDPLPAGMDATGQVTETSGVAALDGDTIVWDGSIPSGGYVVIKYTVDLSLDLEIDDQICNQGTVHWDSDGNGTNDATTRTDDPTTDTEGDSTCLTIDVPVGPLPLSGTIDAPTLSEWGMILASCLFALAFAWHVIRQRRAVAA
ncbi:IPTL-CTERM sorting domain-containing protein [Candidatus Bipolaricaulota bacterium]|nr:IPTL-CTERM sorting domain-containing protein [Candidatus Bipolaricaulota bacterium]